MTVAKLNVSVDMDVRKDIRSGKLQTSIFLFIIFSAALLVFYKYLGADVGHNFMSFWITLGKAAFVAFFLGYKTRPLGDFFVSQPKEIGNDQTSR